jgi:hypothetical protein
MNRRKLLFTGLAAITVSVLGGTAVVALRPVRDAQGSFAPDMRMLWRRVGSVMLDGVWPRDTAAAEQAREAWLTRVEGLVANLPAHARTELDRLLALLRWSLPRRWILDLKEDWTDASDDAVHAALERTNRAESALRQQALAALRDLSLAAYYADESAWGAIGYPGPNPISA